jgi:hypothetical protein
MAKQGVSAPTRKFRTATHIIKFKQQKKKNNKTTRQTLVWQQPANPRKLELVRSNYITNVEQHYSEQQIPFIIKTCTTDDGRLGRNM